MTFNKSEYDRQYRLKNKASLAASNEAIRRSFPAAEGHAVREIWKIVPTEPNYEVSNLGRARSRTRVISVTLPSGTTYLKTVRGRLLKPAKQSNGYFDITVDSTRYKNGKRVPRRRSLASMILEAFVGPRPSHRHQSRHLDDMKINNRLSNLEWGLPIDNANDRIRNGKAYRPKGEKHHNAKLTEDQVRQLRSAYCRYGSDHIKLAKRFGITAGTARHVGSGNGWPHVK